MKASVAKGVVGVKLVSVLRILRPRKDNFKHYRLRNAIWRLLIKRWWSRHGTYLQAVADRPEGCIHLVEAGVVIDVQHAVYLREMPPKTPS